LTIEAGDVTIPTVKNGFTCRVLVILTTLVFVTVLTAAVAHIHFDSDDESHCPLCMAAATTTHALATSIVSVDFTPVQNVLLEQHHSLNLAHVSSIPVQDRAPPKI
jgi:hypothetical protein